MPAGRVKRIDEQRDVAYIVRRGRTLAAPLSEVETKARVPNARVEFRLVRDHGDESAADVRLRRGTRTSRRQRRFGDLTGARRPGSKVATAASRNLGIDTSSPPFEVAEAWLAAMGDRDIDLAASLYRPDAVVHRPGGDASGWKQLRAVLERSPLAGLDPDDADVYGLGRYVRIDCPCDDTDHGTSLIVDRGEIAEQWIDLDPEQDRDRDRATAATAPPFQVARRGSVTDEAQHYARHRVGHLVDTMGRSVRFTRVKLTGIDNPGNEIPAMAEVVLDLDRVIIRAHAAAPTFTEAIDQVIDRLQSRIRQDRSRRRARQRSRETIRTPGAPRPDQPEIVRHRSFAPDELTLDEAIWDLDLLDYEFLLFVEADTGDDAILSHDHNGEMVLQFRRPVERRLTSAVADVSTVNEPPPRLVAADAIELLEAAGGPFLFFVDPSSDRGHVVYRRHDGHYGLITPANEPVE